MSLFEFSVPGFATQRQWSVYIVVATSANSPIKSIYVGKTGDNRDGCNPIITRIGNHLSHNELHSQLRNKLNDTTDFNYSIYFATFGEYTSSNKRDKDRINELERQLNKLIASKIKDREDFKLENPFKGSGFVPQSEREYRGSLITPIEIDLLNKLIDKVIN